MNAVLRPTPQPGGVFARMSELLGTPLASEADAVRLAMRGVPPRAYRRLAEKLKIPPVLVAPESTVRRRLSGNSRFSEAESERVIRLARVYAEAVELFADEAAALHWLNTAQTFIPDESPISPLHLAARDSGARLVEAHIRRTAHGIF